MGALVGSGAVFKELNRVFKDPKSKEYGVAQSNKDLFGGVGVGKGNWQDLVAAYRAAGVTVSVFWEDYLHNNLSPANIYKIAQARFDGLTRGVAMKVKKHTPDANVVVSPEADGSIMIDSPYN
jgi:hypothetical protein